MKFNEMVAADVPLAIHEVFEQVKRLLGTQNSFSEEGNPTLKTTLTVMRAIGIDITAKAHVAH